MITFKLLFVFISLLGFLYGNTLTFSCGRRISSRSLIRGGKKASDGEWPWAASLIHKPSGEFFCSGSLIKPKAVLTAAHCIQQKYSDEVLKPEEVIVQLGITNLKKTQRKKTFQPIEIIVHEDWKTFDDRYDADIALLISEHDMQSLFISPVCLPELSALSSTDNFVGTVIGWGFSSASENINEDVLREVQVVRVSQENCLLVDWRLGQISSNRTFCVAGINDGDGPCDGDSGAGFYVETGGLFSIHGIVSSSIFSGNCPETKHSIMTKADLFLQWILLNVHEVHFTTEYEIKDRSGLPQFRLKLSRVLREGDSLHIDSQTSISNERVILNLSEQKLSFLPNKIGKLFPKVHRIDAKNCEIEQIKRSNFENMEELKELDLRNNLIEEIQSDTFNDLERLRSIQLEQNKLKQIHPKTFALNPELELVYLSENQIQSIVSRNFENSNIKRLFINSNLIETISKDAFDGADSLKYIWINDNKIKILHKDLFSKNPQLIGMDASDNRIEQLPEGLFRSNKHLNLLSFHNNQISEIKTEFSNGFYNFVGNVCINKNFISSFEVENMNAELRQSCRGLYLSDFTYDRSHYLK